MKLLTSATLAIAAVLTFAASASAGPIPNGTVSSSHLFNPTVNMSTDPSTVQFSGQTYQSSAVGGFASAAGAFGTLNGTISFSDTEGNVIAESLANFFVFNDGQGGTFNFSVDSVQTLTFAYTPGVSTGVSLYLLGSTVDTNLGDTATPTSLTVSFNNTRNSAYSSSATLAVPPAPISVPEPISLALVGTGLAALTVVRRQKSV